MALLSKKDTNNEFKALRLFGSTKQKDKNRDRGFAFFK